MGYLHFGPGVVSIGKSKLKSESEPGPPLRLGSFVSWLIAAIVTVYGLFLCLLTSVKLLYECNK